MHILYSIRSSFDVSHLPGVPRRLKFFIKIGWTALQATSKQIHFKFSLFYIKTISDIINKVLKRRCLHQALINADRQKRLSATSRRKESKTQQRGNTRWALPSLFESRPIPQMRFDSIVAIQRSFSSLVPFGEMVN